MLGVLDKPPSAKKVSDESYETLVMVLFHLDQSAPTPAISFAPVCAVLVEAPFKWPH